MPFPGTRGGDSVATTCRPPSLYIGHRQNGDAGRRQAASVAASPKDLSQLAGYDQTGEHPGHAANAGIADDEPVRAPETAAPQGLPALHPPQVPLGQLVTSHTVRTESTDRRGVRRRTQQTWQRTDPATFKPTRKALKFSTTS